MLLVPRHEPKAVQKKLSYEKLMEIRRGHGDYLKERQKKKEKMVQKKGHPAKRIRDIKHGIGKRG